jgi:hypothetical protein
MDASTYGRLVERGGYATGGIVHTAASTQVREWGWLPDRAKRYANPPLGVTYGLDGPSALARLLAGPMTTKISTA